MNREAIDQTRFAVCALGYLKEPQEEAEKKLAVLEITGTGFLVEENLVVTCAHVLADIQQTMKKLRLPPDRRWAQFGVPLQSGEWHNQFRPFKEVEVDELTDLAIVRILRDSTTARPARVVTRDYQPVVGEEIAVCGYAHGTILLRSSPKRVVERLGPLLQRGYIAALAPFDRATPSALLLDLVAAPAASGSPVFLAATGEVIGVLEKGQAGKTPTISQAIPIFRDGGRILTSRQGTTQDSLNGT